MLFAREQQHPRSEQVSAVETLQNCVEKRTTSWSFECNRDWSGSTMRRGGVSRVSISSKFSLKGLTMWLGYLCALCGKIFVTV